MTERPRQGQVLEVQEDKYYASLKIYDQLGESQ